MFLKPGEIPLKGMVSSLIKYLDNCVGTIHVDKQEAAALERHLPLLDLTLNRMFYSPERSSQWAVVRVGD